MREERIVRRVIWLYVENSAQSWLTCKLQHRKQKVLKTDKDCITEVLYMLKLHIFYSKGFEFFGRFN